MLIIFDLDDTLYQRDGIVDDNYQGIENIKLYPNVDTLLRNINCRKILVTKGERSIQLKKIGLLKIRSFFEEIFVCSADEEKKECFQKIKDKFPEETFWVVGDRIDSEIKYGNELGFRTVHLKSGKYKNLKPKGQSEIPNNIVNNWEELSELLCRQ